ncbi:ArsR/SmtB family transcription factor [Lyngbya confervoides]|uniref:Metalloregulator ArsR/SmtB family transcription factor n=1 Tax=Lyngbya confervoides BDU141951 TaxID=1574623 RepID=A0ABD4SZ03_9CYAN|nr:metalloregulator ArsR/SmtB family transcription factor [Lyngbya confervoides]MCM1981503.1 metalloregulator ArsR/SmtB family transcription factor [Lyngbya confervoides BDU141951]
MTSTYAPAHQDALVSGFHALSDPIRMQILEHLRHQEFCVGELCEELNVTQSKLSFHLKVLKDADLVYTRHEGRWIYYSLNLAQLIHLEEYIADFRRHAQIFPPPNSEHSA